MFTGNRCVSSTCIDAGRFELATELAHGVGEKTGDGMPKRSALVAACGRQPARPFSWRCDHGEARRFMIMRIPAEAAAFVGDAVERRELDVAAGRAGAELKRCTGCRTARCNFGTSS